MSDAGEAASTARVLVVAPHVVQYQAPLYRELAQRSGLVLRVVFVRRAGAEAYFDPHFGREVRWDVDLFEGYEHAFLPLGRISKARALAREVDAADVVVVHGHRDPWMLWAAAHAKRRGIPYLLRGESGPEGANDSLIRYVRHVVAGTVTRGAAAAVYTGQRNLEFYERYGQRQTFFAPYSVDNQRFAEAADLPAEERSRRLVDLGLDPELPTVVFAAKMIDRKRPLDLLSAARLLPEPVNLLLIGDGPLMCAVGGASHGIRTHQAGFVNQAGMPGLLTLGDVIVLPSDHEPWGLIVNEAMELGLLPVVSDRVGCAPDLVEGLGQVHRTGDVPDLARALDRACAQVASDRRRVRQAARERVDRYSLAATADGFEAAVIAVSKG